MVPKILASTVSILVLCTSSVGALPKRDQPTYAPAKDLSKLAADFPSSSLPAPAANLQLKYVALGVGTQNYTCGADPTAAPGTTGALATLYDIGSRLNDDPWAKWELGCISCLALTLSQQPELLDVALKLRGFNNVLGHHFFSNQSAVNTPTFALDQLSKPYPIAVVAKVAEADPPSNACPGADGLPPVKWLYLADSKGLSQGAINTVYRVESAGGNKPATCAGQPAHFEVKYSAQYWIYGPK